MIKDLVLVSGVAPTLFALLGGGALLYTALLYSPALLDFQTPPRALTARVSSREPQLLKLQLRESQFRKSCIIHEDFESSLNHVSSS